MKDIRNRAAGLAVTVAAAVWAGACGSSASPGAPSPAPGGGAGGGAITTTSVAVEGGSAVERGATLQLRAVAQRSDGSSQDVSSQATWQSSNPSVATVSATGLLTALTPGSVEVSADYDGRSGRRSVTITVPTWSVQVSLASLVVVQSCDDFTQGLTDAELAYKISVVRTNGQETVLSDTGYPGSAQGSQLTGARRLRQGEAVNLATVRELAMPAEEGEFVRVEFRGTEWDEQIVLIPPSTRWIRDTRMSDRLGSRTHRFSDGAWSGLGNNSITLGSGGCVVRLDYRVSATR